MKHGMLVVLALALVVAPARAEVRSGTLSIAAGMQGDTVAVAATVEGRVRTYVAKVTAKEWQSGLAVAYHALESGGYAPKKVDPVLARIGAALFGPLDAELERCREVEFVVEKGRLREPMDLLHWRGKPLYLSRAVSYAMRWDEEAPAASGSTALETALLIRDRTADPDDGVGACRKLFRKARFYDVGKIPPAKLRAESHADVLLASAHGTVSGKDQNIGIGGEEGHAADFAGPSPRLCYLDSCQMGASFKFVKALRGAGGEYYLAPVCSNEAGDSSTATMRGFFERLTGGTPPVEALFATRVNLTSKYSGAGKDRLYKAAVFRIYRLRD